MLKLINYQHSVIKVYLMQHTIKAISATLFVAFILLSAPQIFSTDNPAQTGIWQSILTNKFALPPLEKAQRVQLSKQQQTENALAGFYLNQFNNNDLGSIKALEELLTINLENEEGSVFFVWLANFCSDNYEDRRLFSFLKTLDLSNAYALTAARVRNYLWNKYNYSFDFQMTDKLQQEIGELPMVSRIVGPFCSNTTQFMDSPLPVEYTPELSDYPDTIGVPVKINKDLKLRPHGYVQIYGHPAPSNSNPVYYLQFTINSDTEQDCLIWLGNSYRIKVWLNTLPIIKIDNNDEDRKIGINRYLIKLRKGRNLLLVKTNSVNSDIGLRSADYSPLKGVTVLPFKQEDWKEAACNPVAGVLYSKQIKFAGKDLPDDATVTAKIIAATRFMQYDLWDEAEQVWSKLAQDYPKSSLINSLYGNFLKSMGRYEYTGKLCPKYLQKALEIYPENTIAAVSLASIFIENKQEQQVLELLEPINEKLKAGGRQNADICWQLAKVYLNKKWTALAAESFADYIRLEPEATQNYLKFLQDTDRIEERNKLLESKLNDPLFCTHCKLDYYLKNNDFAKAREIFKLIRQRNGGNPDDFIHNELRIYNTQENKEKVISCLEKLAVIEPYDPYYCDSIAKFKLEANDKKSALENFRKAFAITVFNKETNFKLLKRINDLQGIESPVFANDIKLSSTKHKDIKKPENSRASYSTVIRLKTMQLLPGQKTDTFEHNAIKVFDKEGISGLSEISIPSEAQIILCQTVAPDGSVFIPDSTENLDLGKAMSMYNVNIDSVLDYSLRVQDGNYPSKVISDSFYFQDFDSDVQHSQYSLILPRGALTRTDIKTFPEDFQPEIREDGDNIILTWKAANEKGKIQEPMLSSLEPVRRSVRVTIYPTFDWGYTFTEPCNAKKYTFAPLTAKAREITAKARTIKEKTRLIYDWVTQNITPPAENNDDALRKNTARNCFMMRSGNEDAKLNLMQQMLFAAGVESYRCSPNYLLNDPTYLKTRGKIAANFYGQKMLKIKGEKIPDNFWGTIRNEPKFYEFTDLEKGTIGISTRTISNKGVELDSVYPQHDSSVATTEHNYKINPDKSASVEQTIYVFGSFGGSLRQELENPDSAKKLAFGIASSVFPRITDTKITYPKANELTASDRPDYIYFTIKGRIKDFCTPAANGLSIKPDLFPLKSMTTPLPRLNNMQISSDKIFKNVLSYTAPEGWNFSTLPQDIFIESDFGVFSMDYNLTGNTLTLCAYCIIPAQIIKAKDCKKFNEFIDKASVQQDKSLNILRSPNTLLKPRESDSGSAKEFVIPFEFKVLSLPENVKKLIK